MHGFGSVPVFDDILAAERRLAGHAVRTPLLESERLNNEAGLRILIKPEMLQKTGAFKFRGAYNRICMIDPATRKKGVVAYSSGNHAQAVAFAAHQFSVPAVIVMPADAPKLKIEGSRRFGAEIIFYDRNAEDREAIGEAVAKERGMTLVRPYDDTHIIAGQGTIGLEIADDLEARGIRSGSVVAPAGGGGLVAGTALALSHRLPEIRVFSAEPAGFDDHKRSLESGARVANEAGPASSADSLMALIPGVLTFEMNRSLLSGGFSVDETAIHHAMRILFHDFRLIAEAGGATALAAVMAHKDRFQGEPVVAVCSGGNVDAETLLRILQDVT